MTDFTHSLAVLIGIDAYEHGVPPLTNAVNDTPRLGRSDKSDRIGASSPLGFMTGFLRQPVDSVRLQVRLDDLLQHAIEMFAAALRVVAHPPTLAAPLDDGFNVSAHCRRYLAAARFS